MTAALEGGEWSAARPGRTLLPGKSRYPFYRRLCGPQGRSGRPENLGPTGIRSRTVQPVASHYTDYATQPTRALVPSSKIWNYEAAQCGHCDKPFCCHVFHRRHRPYTLQETTLCQAKKEATGTARPDTKTGRKNRSNSVRTQNLQVCYWILLGPCFM